MNRSDAEDGRHEFIVVRRGGHDDDEGHHGGVWKIAFADFMTAMMCFFLVMWLINATNEETRTALASYFNPIKLVDQRTSRKGLDDIGEGPQTSSDSVKGQALENPPSDPEGPETAAEEEPPAVPLQPTDENLFSDPYAVLAEIAADTGRLQNISAMGEGGAHEAGPATGASGGDSYRDPFAPNFWSTQVEQPADETARKSVPEGRVAETAQQDPERFADAPLNPFATQAPDEPALPDEELEELLADALPEPEPELREAAAAEAAPDRAASDAGADDAAGESPAAQPGEQGEAAQADAGRSAAEDLAEKIRSELADAFGTAQLDGITVEQSDAGVMISVADDMEEGMFEIGSAVPRRNLVLAMEKIGKTLAAHDGTITINGHTDARPFQSGDYDNWRLSTARAHSTYYMLVRGGLDESRIAAVTGFADRRLKRPDDPFASVNRRIEILLGASG